MSHCRPKSETRALPSVEAACEWDLNPDNKGPVPHEDYSEDSLASRGSSGFGSLPRKTRTSLVTGGLCKLAVSYHQYLSSFIDTVI